MICSTFQTASHKSYQRDQDCIQAMRNGNSQALEEFYLITRREFLKWSEKSFGLDSMQAMDVYQDAIIILFENIRRGKLNQLNASLKTYFYGIGKNLILGRMARAKAERKRWEVAFSNYTTDEIALYPDDREESLEAVKSGLEELSTRNKAILKLYYYRQLPLKDIAQRLGYENVDVVKNQKVRCIKYLKKQVEQRLKEIN
jgi:RNA polymerase sigma factor (sigma-70 family)